MSAQSQKLRHLITNPGTYLVTGPSGCGKTTLVEVFQPEIYMTQYHALRPYARVETFFPLEDLKLPFFVAKQQKFGGEMMPGKSIKGLSGGQRKLCLLAHINLVACRQAKPILIVVDEPIAGVTSNFIPHVLDVLRGWVAMGHTIVVIDNDHHDITTNQGWHRIQLGVRKVIRFDDEEVDIDIPLMRISSRPVERNVRQDIRLFVKSDVCNGQAVGNSRFTLAVVLSLIAFPLCYKPTIDMGAILQNFLLNFFFLAGGSIYQAAREREYNNVMGESAIGLVTHPGLTFILSAIQDLALGFLFLSMFSSLHAIWWGGIDRYTPWQLAYGCAKFTTHQLWLNCSTLHSGAPIIWLTLLQPCDMVVNLFFGGAFSATSGIFPPEKYAFVACMSSHLMTATESIFAPLTESEAPLHYYDISSAAYLVVDCCMALMPYVVICSRDRRSQREPSASKAPSLIK